MAVSTVRTLIANPARKRAGRKANVARRLSLKQKLHFGSKAQRAAAKRAMKAKRNPSHRARTKPRKRKNTARALPRRKAASKRHAPRRKNMGELVVASLGNPATKRRKNTMAHTKRKPKKNTAHRRPRRAAKRNPSHRKGMHRRRNPGMGGVGNLVTQGIGVVGGAVGSKIATQAILGASNTGIMGYLGNAVATGLLAWGANAFLHKREIGNAVMLGGAVQIILRAINDFTPYGQYLSLSGLGDYQVANWATPQWLPNGLKSANPAVPAGWGGGAAVAVNSSGAGVSGVPSWD